MWFLNQPTEENLVVTNEDNSKNVSELSVW